MANEVPRARYDQTPSQTNRDRGSCSTCDIIGKFTGGFWELTPQVEAIYLEHLIREHDIQP